MINGGIVYWQVVFLTEQEQQDTFCSVLELAS